MKSSVWKLAAATALVVGMTSMGAAVTEEIVVPGDTEYQQEHNISLTANEDSVYVPFVHYYISSSNVDSEITANVYVEGDLVASKSKSYDSEASEEERKDNISFDPADYNGSVSSGDTIFVELLGNVVIAGNTADNIQYSGSLVDIQDSGSDVVWAYTYEDTGPALKVEDGLNKPPEFNSSSIEPDPPLIGESVSYGAEPDDPDGDNSNLNTTLTLFKDGNQVFQDSQSGSPVNFSDVYTVQSEGELDARFESTDSAGATTTEWINRTLEDTAPSVSISNLDNETYYSYSRDASITVTDSDSNPDEDITCGLYIDGSQYDTQTVVEGSSFTTTSEADLGSHTFKASCSDPAGNTNNQTVDYTVDLFNFNSLSGSSNVFEKTNQSFSIDYNLGDMVNNVDYKLNYDGSQEALNSVDYSSNGVITNDIVNLYHVVPFVGSDGTSKSYSVDADINYTEFNGGNTVSTESSGSNTQSIDQAYKFGSHNLEDGFTQLEGSTLDYTATVDEVSNSLATVEGLETSYSQTGSTKQLSQDSGLNYSNSFNSDLINSSSETFSFDTTVTLTHGNDNRTFTSTSNSLTLDKIVLEESSNSDNAEALEFVSQDEVNESSVESDLELGLNVANPDQPDKSRFYGFDVSGSSSHSFYINPGYGEVVAKAFERNQITYQNQDKNYNKRRYYLINEKLNNQTTTVNLYMLKDSEGQNVEFELLDEDLRALSSHIVRIERSIPDQEDTRVVALFRTDNEGKATAFVDSDEQYIYTVYNEQGELVGNIGPQGITGLSSTLQLESEDLPNFDNLINDVRFTDVQENNESLVVDYTSDTEKLNNIRLEVSESGLFSNKVIDSDSSNQLQGRLSVDGFNASNQSVSYDLVGTFGETNLTLKSGTIGDPSSDYGDTGIFMGLFMFLALTISGLWKPSASIGLGVVGMFVLYFIGFLPISQTALISIAVLGSLLVWRMS